ncbi:MAG: FixH family protein [Candidatus Eisenbacteria bacterium]
MNRTQRSIVVGAASLLLVPLVMFARAAFAHEGVDHGAKPVDSAPIAGSIAATSSHSASSRRHELVVASAEIAPLTPTRLDFYVSDWATNAPIEGASVRFEFRPRMGGAATASSNAIPTGRPGVYAATLRAPTAGAYNLVVSLKSSLGADEFALTGFVVTASHFRPAERRPLLLVGVGALIVIVGIAAVVHFGRRRAARESLAPQGAEGESLT